jgi:hypothetical protein
MESTNSARLAEPGKAVRAPRRVLQPGRSIFAVVLAIGLVAFLSSTAGASKLRIWQPGPVDSPSPAPQVDQGRGIGHAVGPLNRPSPTPSASRAPRAPVQSCCPVGSLASACRIASVQMASFRHVTFVGDPVFRLPPLGGDCRGLPYVPPLRLCRGASVPVLLEI